LEKKVLGIKKPKGLNSINSYKNYENKTGIKKEGKIDSG